MKNYDQLVEINHNTNGPYIPHHPYRILIIGGSGSGKTIILLNLFLKFFISFSINNNYN